MKKNYKEIVSAYCLCNTASLNIWDIEHGRYDYVWAGCNNEKPRKYNVYYTGKGGYFKWGGKRYYLCEFLKV